MTWDARTFNKKNKLFLCFLWKGSFMGRIQNISGCRLKVKVRKQQNLNWISQTYWGSLFWLFNGSTHTSQVSENTGERGGGGPTYYPHIRNKLEPVLSRLFFNRPRAVLQTPSSLIYSLIHWLNNWSISSQSSKHQFWEQVHLPPPVMCYMSHFICHMTHVLCH